MSWGTATSRFFRWAHIGILFSASIVLTSPACFGQQTSRRMAPKSDENTKPTSATDFSGVDFRTPRISLKSDDIVGDSDLIPVSESSRRRVARAAANLQDEIRQELQLKPTLSPNTKFVASRPNQTSNRRVPNGNLSAMSAATEALPDAIVAHPRVAQVPATQSTQQQNVPNRMDFVQPFPDQPFAQPPIVTIQEFESQSARSVADNLGNIRLKNAAQYLSQKREFQNPNKYLAKPAQPTRQAMNASTRIRRSPVTFSEPMNRSNQEIAQDDSPKSTATAPSETEQSDATQTQDDVSLGKFADINAPIPPVPFAQIYQVADPKLLGPDPYESKVIYQGDLFNYAQLTESVSIPCGKAWLAPNFYHRPLYFEETNLERYGNRLPMQLFVSAAHFFVTLPIIPYKMGANPPYQCTYTYGHQRPGDCVPFQIHRLPFSIKGSLNQALITSAIVVP